MNARQPETGIINSIESTNSSYRHQALALALMFVLLLLGCFYETAWSVVSIWIRSDTYAHGFLILPIVGWMIWGRREALYVQIFKPEFLALIPLVASGFAWLLGALVDVLVVQQFALLGMLICGVWLILGTAACRQVAYPLAYLIFLIPVGEGLVPPMMEFTATFTVAMVQLTGIPVYREGLYFILPTGNWSVVEACSGVRYLIASIALGALYAYINYQSYWRRAVFILVSVIVPILANGLRAYIIVMLGHMSDMTIATGVDHLIYGWVFFGLVMFLLFYIGSFWQEPDAAEGGDTVAALNSEPVRKSLLNTAVATAVVASLSWLWLAGVITQRSGNEWHVVKLPSSLGAWYKKPLMAGWEPLDGGAEHKLSAAYGEAGANPVDSVQLFVHAFNQQEQGVELVPGMDLMVPDEDKWRVVSRGASDKLNQKLGVTINETHLKGSWGRQYLVWHWYRIGDLYTASNYKAKIHEAVNKLSFARQDSARLFVSVSLDENGDLVEARGRLQKFVVEGLDGIEAELDRGAGVTQ